MVHLGPLRELRVREDAKVRRLVHVESVAVVHERDVLRNVRVQVEELGEFLAVAYAHHRDLHARLSQPRRCVGPRVGVGPAVRSSEVTQEDEDGALVAERVAQSHGSRPRGSSPRARGTRTRGWTSRQRARRPPRGRTSRPPRQLARRPARTGATRTRVRDEDARERVFRGEERAAASGATREEDAMTVASRARRSDVSWRSCTADERHPGSSDSCVIRLDPPSE